MVVPDDTDTRSFNLLSSFLSWKKKNNAFSGHGKVPAVKLLQISWDAFEQLSTELFVKEELQKVQEFTCYSSEVSNHPLLQ